MLTELIGRAARENRDIKIAMERVRAARGGETISRSSLWPSIGSTAGAVDQSTGYGDAVKRDVPDVETGTAALSVSWELDLSGRLRAGAAAAAADTMATEDVARGVRLLVLSDVATSYFTLVGALEQLETVRAISAAHDETLRLVTARERAGLASPFDVERARTDASTARATIPPLETLAAVARHRIAVLIGDQAFERRDHRALERRDHCSRGRARTAGGPSRAAAGPARCARAARSREFPAPAGRRGMVPAPVRERAVRPPELGAERQRSRNRALY